MVERTVYNVGDLVTNGGLAWQCNTAGTNITPKTDVTQKGLYYALPWRAVGANAQALWAPLSITGTPTAGP
jgi:hypothetical protein